MDHVEALIDAEAKRPRKTYAIKLATGETNSGLVQRTLPLDSTVKPVPDKQAITANELTTIDKSAFPKGSLENRKGRT